MINLNITNNCKCMCGGNDLEYCGCLNSVKMFKVISIKYSDISYSKKKNELLN